MRFHESFFNLFKNYILNIKFKVIQLIDIQNDLHLPSKTNAIHVSYRLLSTPLYLGMFVI